ncbi:hypothetical protein [Pseudodonghicola xiamenensis]|uniref:Uncharacterized protein n=1 Tax=Pseudodonghicola xiamenensis TaxID=337702 RepID=A0A8J3HDI8_9RHOB|nr:hypothetical protein [Pseudodonghicola xiamenensis]GHH05637.1 hypothetical protein GCM10010961_44590 [Pseudodonghicola xiamenensis]
MRNIMTLALISLASPIAAQDGFSHNRDLSHTRERAGLPQSETDVGDVNAPGYNPNALRPAGDGLGRHTATETLQMQGHPVRGLSLPTRGDEAANKDYVDQIHADLSDQIGALSMDLGTVLSVGNQGRGRRVADIADPIQPQDAVTKSYVDALFATLSDTEPAALPFVYARLTAFATSEADPNLFYYTCDTPTLAADGTRGCATDGYRTITPVAPADFRFYLEEASVMTVYNLSVQVAEGDCHLRDIIGEEETTFGGGYMPATDGNPSETIHVGDLIPAAWGHSTGRQVTGPGAISYGCSTRWRAHLTSPENADWSQTLTNFSGDLRATAPRFPTE